MNAMTGTRVVNDLWPAAPRVPDQRPDSFSKTFGYTMIALHLRSLSATAKGLSAPERQAFACLADGIDAGICDNLDEMHDAIDAANEMERCRA